jgi:hypothetical protein
MIDEDALRALLHDAAGRIPVEPELDAILADTAVVPIRADAARHRRWPWYLVAAAVVVAVAAVGVVATGGTTDPVLAGAPDPVPAGAPAPGTIAPWVESPPGWFGEGVAAQRPSAVRTGRWTRAALGVVDGDEVRGPITVAAYDGTFKGTDGAVEVRRHGHPFVQLRAPDTDSLFTIGSPTVMVTGPRGFDLAAVALDTHVADVGGQLRLTLDRLPPGYSVLVPPQVLAEDVASRHSFASKDGSYAVHEVSDLVVPLLGGAGADLQRVDVGGTTGWYFHTVTSDGRWIGSVVWSPEPGVVFEAVSVDRTHARDSLVELAEATEVVPAS